MSISSFQACFPCLIRTDFTRLIKHAFAACLPWFEKRCFTFKSIHVFWWFTFFNLLAWRSLARETYFLPKNNICVLTEDWGCPSLNMFRLKIWSLKVAVISFHAGATSLYSWSSCWAKIELATFVCIETTRVVLDIRKWKSLRISISTQKAPRSWGICRWVLCWSLLGFLSLFLSHSNIPYCHSTILLYKIESIRNFSWIRWTLISLNSSK